ncbi:MAG: DUF6777 domain-containing protein [Acidimicrobiia bacterium]
MSDTPQGPGWWKASDDKWYPPEQHPDYQGGSSPDPVEPSGQPSSGDAAVPPTTPPAATPPTTPPAAAAGVPGATTGAPNTPGAAPGATQTAAKENGSKSKLIVAVVAVIAVIAAGFVLVNVLGDDKASADGVALTPLGKAGADGFTASFATEPTGSLRAFAEKGAPTTQEGDEGDDENTDADNAETGIDRKAGYKSISGDVPGLYGGTLDELSCDVDQLSTFLADDEAKATAFAGALTLDPADLDAYLDGLTPVNLGSDTRVLSHGFKDGAAVASEAVLQRGSAVLVDARGVPRVNCYGGNPLLPPSLGDNESFSGDKWGTFDPAEVVAVEESSGDIDEFDLIDVETGEMFSRKAGKGDASQGRDRPAQTGRPIDGEIELDKVYNDRLEDDRLEARYTFIAPDSGVITFRLENDRESTNSVRVEIYNVGSRLYNKRINPNDSTEWTLVLDHESGGQFEIILDEGPALYSFELASDLQKDAGQQGDAGSSYDTAFEIEAGEKVNGRLGNHDRLDTYLVELPAGVVFSFTAETPRDSSTVKYEIYFEGSRVFNGRVNPGGKTEWSQLFSDKETGYLEIYVTETEGAYSFQTDITPQEDGGIEGDAPGDLASARLVPVGEELNGQVGGRDPADYYLFDVTDANMTFQIANAATSMNTLRFEIYNESGNRLLSHRVNPGANDQREFEAEVGERYALYIDEGRAEYTFGFNISGE